MPAALRVAVDSSGCARATVFDEVAESEDLEQRVAERLA